jgi:WD40 repeat protein
MKEDGLSFYQGNVQAYKRWQNSPAKYRDFEGHKGSVTSCKISPCQEYILSSSADTTLRLWRLKTAECLKIYTGHSKTVNDCDFHPISFKMYSTTLCLISCSGDNSLKIWNTSERVSKVTILGHESAVYKCSFSPDGHTIVSCSEDKTIRTWNFPEGYNIFIFRGHAAPVISIRYSASGRFATDYRLFDHM